MLESVISETRYFNPDHPGSNALKIELDVEVEATVTSCDAKIRALSM